MLLYTVLFSVISFRRYDAFSYSDFDFSIFVHEYWKIAHGSARISLFLDVPIWGNAMEFFSVLMSPIFALFNFNPKSLLFLQAFGLGAGAIPIFLISRRLFPEKVAACFAISYLFYPSIWYANLYEYNALVFMTFTLLMAFYSLQSDRFGMFMFFVLVSIINRADVGIVTFMFGVYALMEKKGWKWVIWPSLVSFLWVAASLLFIIPKFKGALSYDSNYPQFGKGFDEIIRNMIFHPEILWKSLTTSDDAKFFFQILYPVGFISLLGLKQFLICGLSLIQHLASVRYQEHTILFHYTSTITPFVYISAAYGMARLIAKRDITFIMCALPIVLSLLANCFYGPIKYYREYTYQLQQDAEDIYKKELLKEIPKDLPAVSSFEFSPMLAGRNRFYSFHYIYGGLFAKGVPYQTPSDIQYALINFQDPRMLGFRQNDSHQKMRAFISEGRFGVVDKINSIALLKKGHSSDMKLYDVLTPAQPIEGGVAEGKNGARILRVDSQLIEKRGQNVLRLSFHWGTMNKVREDFWLALAVFDSKDKQVYAQTRQNVYGLYPSSLWAPGQEIIDYYDMLLPASLKAGEYKVYVALLTISMDRYILINKIDGNALVGKPQWNIMVAKFRIPDQPK